MPHVARPVGPSTVVETIAFPIVATWTSAGQLPRFNVGGDARVSFQRMKKDKYVFEYKMKEALIEIEREPQPRTFNVLY